MLSIGKRILLLFAVAVCCIGSVCSSAQASSQWVEEMAEDSETKEALTWYYAQAKEVLNLVNEERAKVGVAPMTLSDDLMSACLIRADEIAVKFSHERPNGERFYTVLIDGPNYYYGENIAGGTSTPADTMKMWMNSPGHRKNILNPEYTKLGVGYNYEENSQYKHYWVQIFQNNS